MFRKFLPALAACLIVAGYHAPLRADDTADKDAESQMDELFKTLAISLQGGTPSPNAQLTLMSPGLALSRGFNAAKNDADKQILKELVDTIPLAEPKYVANGTSKYSDVTRMVLENHQLTTKIELSPDEKARLAKARAITNDDSPEQQAYEKYKRAYFDATDAMDAASMGGKQPSSRIKSDVADAQKKWVANGYKNEIDAAYNVIQQLSSKDGTAWWQSMADRFTTSKEEDGSMKVSFFPDPGKWSSSAWTTITFKYGQKADSSKMTSESVKASVSGSYRWFSTDSSFSKDDVNAKDLMSHKDLSLSFEVLRVNIYRPWLPEDIFRNRYWTLPRSVGGGVISYGTIQRNRKDKPLMPGTGDEHVPRAQPENHQQDR